MDAILPQMRRTITSAGLMIMNDMSARRLQMQEMVLNLGPAKGKDFATVTGPMLVTTDELQQFEVPL
jgi:fumarylacetoacetate (FAA) hydrolase